MLNNDIDNDPHSETSGFGQMTKINENLLFIQEELSSVINTLNLRKVICVWVRQNEQKEDILRNYITSSTHLYI